MVMLSMSLLSCAGGPAQKEAASPVLQQKLTPSDVDSDTQDAFAEALVLLKDEKYDKAIEILKGLVEKEQRFAAPFVNLGMAYIKKGDNKTAEEYLTRALDIDLGHPVANNELGLIYRKSGRFEDARKAYENALVVHPDYLPARKNLGILCEIYLRDLNCALEQFEQYQQYVPDDKTINIWVTDLRRRTGQ
jgi:tetratricopeptide (TPR) repeat protein